MSPTLDYQLLYVPGGLSDEQAGALLAVADGLRGAGPATVLSAKLRGSNIALVSDQLETESAAVFDRAASKLGARVAHIRSSDLGLGTDSDLRATARMLGRLYEAVECQGMDERLVRQLQVHAGIVVFNELASLPLQAFGKLSAIGLADAMPFDVDRREALIQAVLLSTLR